MCSRAVWQHRHPLTWHNCTGMPDSLDCRHCGNGSSRGGGVLLCVIQCSCGGAGARLNWSVWLFRVDVGVEHGRRGAYTGGRRRSGAACAAPARPLGCVPWRCRAHGTNVGTAVCDRHAVIGACTSHLRGCSSGTVFCHGYCHHTDTQMTARHRWRCSFGCRCRSGVLDSTPLSERPFSGPLIVT